MEHERYFRDGANIYRPETVNRHLRRDALKISLELEKIASLEEEANSKVPEPEKLSKMGPETKKNFILDTFGDVVCKCSKILSGHAKVSVLYPKFDAEGNEDHGVYIKYVDPLNYTQGIKRRVELYSVKEFIKQLRQDAK